MSDVNANINIRIDTSQAENQLRALQSQISSFNRSLGAANSSAATQAAALNRALLDGINSSRMFDARMVPVVSRVDAFSHALEKNKLTLGEYSRYAASQLPGLSRVFRTEFDTMERTARDRVKRINAQYVELGKSARGVREALQATPTGLAAGAATELAVATQRQQMFNKLIDDGSTKLLNWGKNTQWAGRQLMVGFTLPLAALGTAAAQAFMEIDKATVAFERVYGDLSTTTAEMERNKGAVMSLASEYTKYGIAVSDTIQLSAKVAATGLVNADMLAATEQALRFATLGQIDYNQALDATIALQSAFNVQSKDLGNTIDYLNAVENQTVLSIEDMSAAIPRVATVIQGLGGDVRDLAVFMTAMREGGVSAENGANALKSGLASLINPTDRAQESMKKLGIDMQTIINANRGDLMATVKAFGDALSRVDEFSKTQALEQIFGKYQYARMAALFDNIARSSSQAARAMDLANMSVAELAALSDKELSKIEESTTVKFQAAMERLKLSIAPLGEAFLKGIMPIMDGLTALAEAFNKLPDPVKNVFAVITGIVAGLGPVFLMTIGLIGNGLANLVKGIQFFRRRLAGIRGDSENFQYLATAELEAKAASDALEGSVTGLTSALNIQKIALGGLIRQYQRYATAAGIASGAASRGRASATQIRMARGGVVPGSGSGDKVPALLEPGETVVTKRASQRFGPIINAMNAGTLQGFQRGRNAARANRGVVFAHGQAPQNLTQEEIDLIRSLAPRNQYIQSATRMQSLSNFGFMTPKAFNQGRMTGQSAAQLFSNPRLVDRTMYPMYKAIADNMGRSVETVMQDPRIQREVRGFAAQIGTGLAEQGARRIADADFYAITDRALREAQLSENVRGPIEASKRATTLAVYGGEGVRSKGERIGLSQGRQRAFFGGTAGTGSYRSWRNIRSAIPMIGGRARQTAGMAGQTTGQAQLIEAQDVLGINSPAKEGEKLSESVAEGQLIGAKKSAKTSAKAGQVAGEAQIAGLKEAANAKAIYRASQSAQREELRQIDLIPQTRQRLRDQAMREAAAGAGGPGKDRRQAIRAARRRVEEMSDEEILTIVKQEESQRIAREKTASAERRAIRAKSDSEIARSRNRESGSDKKAAIAREAAAARIAQDAIAAATGYDGGGAAPTGGRLSRLGAGMMRRSGTIGMGLGIASMIPFMAQNEQGQFMGMNANALGMGMATAGMAFDMASLLKLGPIMGVATKAAGALGLSLGGLAAATGGVTLAVGGAIIAYKLWRDSVDNASRAAADLGANLGGTANALNNMSAILGKMTPAQAQTQLRLGITDQQLNEEMAQWANMLSEGPGKTFIDGLKSATSEERFKQLGDYIRYGIASGAMDITQARQFADAVALQLDDALLSIRVKSAIANQQTGTNAMMALARGREASVLGSAALAEIDKVLRPGDRFTNTEATNTTQVIGGSLQVIQDFANASAVAAQELASGKISQEEYEKAVKESNDSIKISTDNMIKAIRATDDLGGTMAAFNDQLVKLGLTAEQASAIAEMSGVGITASGFGTGANQAQVRAEAGAAVAQGMAFENIKAIYDYMESESGRAVASMFARVAGTGQSYGLAGLQMSMEQGGVPGLQGQNEAETRANIERTMDVGVRFVEMGGTAADFQQFLMSIPSEKVITIQQRYVDANGNVTNPQKLKQEIDTYNKLLGSLGSEAAYAVTEKTGGQVSQKTIDAAATLKQIFGENQEAITGYINIAMRTEPNGLETYLPQITKEIENLNAKVPPEIQKLIGIDLQNPEDVEKYGPMADALSLLVPIIENLPDEQKEFAVSIMFNASENGEPKDPVTFGKDIALYNKTLDKLRSTSKKVRKQAIIDLIIKAYDAQGKEVDPRQAADAMNYMIQELGITEGEFIQLPPDTIAKIIQFAVEARGLEESAKTYQAAADAAFAAGDTEAGRMLQNAANKMFVAAGVAQKSAAAAAGAGFAQGGNELPARDSGGGGGDKADPVKDFMESLKEKLKLYTNLPSLLEKLKGKKGQIEKLLPQIGFSNSLAQQMRRAGLNENLIADILSKGYKDAKKIWSSIKGRVAETNRMQFTGSIAADVEASRATRKTNKNIRAVTAALEKRGFSEEEIAGITQDTALVNDLGNALEEGKGKFNEWAQEKRKALSSAIKEPEDILGTLADELDASHERIVQSINDQIDGLNEQIRLIQTQIDDLKKLNSADQDRINGLERQKEMIQRQIAALERANEMDQRRIESLRREDELRNRTAEALSHELELMSKVEEDIRDAYQKRIEALDKVAQINDYILNQQKSQLGLSQALSQGDIYAAAQAAQEMQAQQVQFAAEQNRAALQQGMEGQIAGLTTSGGLTREQAEAQIAAIKEQSYQTSLQIRDIEDQIYARNQEIIPLKDQQYQLDLQIQGIQDIIYERTQQIKQIEDEQIAPLNGQVEALNQKLAAEDKSYANGKAAIKQAQLMVKATGRQKEAALYLAKQWQNVLELINAANDSANKRINQTKTAYDAGVISEVDYAAELADIEKERQTAIDQAYRTGTNAISASAAPVTSGNELTSADIYYMTTGQRMAAGGIVGTGGRDSVPAMLTPGEFIIRKSAVRKYGPAMFEKINMGAFSLPNYDINNASVPRVSTENTKSNINAPVYNSYSISVPVTQPNASADEIAHKVITKIRNIEGGSIRRINGY